MTDKAQQLEPPPEPLVQESAEEPKPEAVACAPIEERGLALSPEAEGGMIRAFGHTWLPSVEDQKEYLAEFDARRNHFQRWLLSHLQSGVHYGFPPGCEVQLNADGNIVQRYYNKRTSRYEERIIPKEQWQSKPSLYKAGALLLIELLGLEAEYHADPETWRMLGEPKGLVVRKCVLGRRRDGKFVPIGEGTGAYKVGEKQMTENPTVKMADKRAAVAAVVNTIQVVADLFTQDMEDKRPSEAKPRGHDMPEDTLDEESPKDPQKEQAQTAMLSVLQTLSDRDCKGWKVTVEQARSCYTQGVELSGIKDPLALADWLKENAALATDLDGEGAVTGLIVTQREPEPTEGASEQ